jgi:phosphoglycerol transferase MdoB-like AlkP superfamily enzyme
MSADGRTILEIASETADLTVQKFISVSRPSPSTSKPVHSRGKIWILKCQELLRNQSVLCLLGFALIWLLELYWFQARTLVPSQGLGARFAFWAPKIRFVLDIFFIGAVCSFLRARWLMAIACGSFLAHVVLITYTNIFSQPLSLLTAIASWREGVSVAPFALSWLPPKPTIALAIVLAVQILLLRAAAKQRFSSRDRLALGGCSTLAYAALFGVTLLLDPLSAAKQSTGVARLGVIRGYVGPWFAELYYLNDERLLQNAVEQHRRRSSDLVPIEANIPIHDRLVIIQVESLDYNILGYRANGIEVTPFLNSLREQSMLYKVRAFHPTGSADADFTMLTGGPPATHVLNYNLPNFPYDDTLPQILGKNGFKTYAFHGNTGQFYNRRSAFEKMGFTEFSFREELEPRGAFEIDRLGLQDRGVLDYSSLTFRQEKGPVCHFVITLTSHTPYVFLKANDREVVPHPSDAVDRYFNHMRYVDNCLRDYFTSLGKHVTVVLYSDHPTEEGKDDFQPARVGPVQYVPVFVYDSDRNLGDLQRTRASRAMDGSLNIVDFVSYLRSQIELNFAGEKDDLDAVKKPSKPSNVESKTQ